jgi:hypothetical protein
MPTGVLDGAHWPIGYWYPIEYPNTRLPSPLQKQENPDAIGVFEWRDPDSNRGHHDFQSCGGKHRTTAKSLENTGFFCLPYDG